MVANLLKNSSAGFLAVPLIRLYSRGAVILYSPLISIW